MATHSSMLAGEIPWTAEPGGLQSTGLQSQTRLSTQHTHSYLLRKDQLCFQRQPPLARAEKHSYHPLQQAHWGVWGLPWWLSSKESTCQCRRHGSDPWSRKIPHATEQLSARATATEPVPQSLGAATAACEPESPCSPLRVGAAVRCLCTATREQPSLAATREDCKQLRPSTAKK